MRRRGERRGVAEARSLAFNALAERAIDICDAAGAAGKPVIEHAVIGLCRPRKEIGGGRLAVLGECGEKGRGAAGAEEMREMDFGISDRPAEGALELALVEPGVLRGERRGKARVLTEVEKALARRGISDARMPGAVQADAVRER